MRNILAMVAVATAFLIQAPAVQARTAEAPWCSYASTGHFNLAEDCSFGTFEACRDTVLAGKVPSTGNWDTYRQINVGVVTLKPGRKQLTLRSAGKINGNLMDLKSVRVTPVETD